MGTLWKDCTKEELALNYNNILWSLEEGMHSLVRVDNSTNYIIPQYLSTSHFEELKPGIEDAKLAVEKIWKERYGEEEIPTLELQRISKEEYDIKSMGWEVYKEIKISSLDSAEESRKQQ